MVIRPLLLIFSLILAYTAFCQEEEQDSLTRKRFIIPSVYIDYGKLFTIPSSVETKYEGAIELLMNEKLQFIAEVGSATLNPEGAYRNGTYESDGIYYRIGFGYLAQPQTKNKIGISLRYAVSNFNEDGRIFIESASGVQENVVRSINRQDLSAQWWELVLNTDRKLNDLLSIGMHLRFRVLQSYDEQEEIDVYAIPGYGRSFDNTLPAVNLFIKASF